MPHSARFVAGDPLRALAALGIMAFHLLGAALVVPVPLATQADTIELMRAGYGPVGQLALLTDDALAIFFVLSGYLISRPFVASCVGQHAPPPPGRYALARLLRIAPAFWVAVLLTALVLGTFESSPGEIVAVPAFVGIYARSGFFDHIAQSWTLTAELAFYISLPLAFAALRPLVRTLRSERQRLLAVTAATLGVSAVCVMATLIAPPRFDEQPGPLRIGVAFAPGVLLAIIELALGTRARQGRGLRVAHLMLGGGLIAVIAYAALLQRHFFHGAAVDQVVVSTCAGLIVGGLLVRQWSGAPCWAALDNRVLQALGRRSYAIYVLHAGIIFAVLDLLKPDGTSRERLAVLAPATLVLTLVLAEPLHRWVELPCLRLKRPVGASASGRPASSGAEG